MDEASEVNKADRREAQVNETKITSVEKAKDPKRVEAGKKLGAMSKQAKEKKASQRVDIEEFQIPSIDSIDPLIVVGVLGLVGTVVYYKYFSEKKSDPTPAKQAKQEEVSTPTPAKQAEQPQERKLDSLD